MEQLVERYRRLPPQVKLLILLLITGGAVAYGWTSNVEPALENQKAAVEENSALDKEVEALNKAGQGVVAVESQLRKADEEIAALLDLLPGEPEIERVLAYFASASKETGVEVKEFEPVNAATQAASAVVDPVKAVPEAEEKKRKGEKAVSTDESVTHTTLKVKLHGTFAQIATFFDRILGLPRVVRLTGFELAADKGTSSTGPASTDVVESAASSPKLTVSATFDAFSQRGLIDQFKKEEQESPKAKAPAPPATAGARAPPGGPPVPPAGGGSAAVPATPPPAGNATSLSAKSPEGVPAP